jgi:hypothetical protein
MAIFLKIFFFLFAYFIVHNCNLILFLTILIMIDRRGNPHHEEGGKQATLLLLHS